MNEKENKNRHDLYLKIRVSREELGENKINSVSADGVLSEHLTAAQIVRMLWSKV